MDAPSALEERGLTTIFTLNEQGEANVPKWKAIARLATQAREEEK